VVVLVGIGGFAWRRVLHAGGTVDSPAPHGGHHGDGLVTSTSDNTLTPAERG
jgi:hypothetical protein